MPLFKIEDLQTWTGGKWINPTAAKPEIRGFSADSRNLKEHSAFVALVAKRDGHDFIEDAIKNGAVAVIASKEIETSVPVLVVKDTLKALQIIAKFHRLRFDNPVIGITGSCGKTSTKEFLAKLISWKNPLVTEKNLNNEIGVALTLTSIDLKMNQAAIVEAGVSAPGQMEELAVMIEPDLAIITNVGLAHMEKFEELSKVSKEKAILARHAANGGWCLIHSTLLSWKAFEDLSCRKAVVAPAEGGEVKADLVFRYAVLNTQEGRKLDIAVEGGSEFCFDLPEFSAGMTENAALAVAACLMLGGREEQIAVKLQELSALPMRGLVAKIGASNYYVDCYNASPTSMKDALAHFAKIAEGAAKLYVIGEMAELGISALRHHKDVGALIPYKVGDKAVLTGAHTQTYKAAMLEKGWPAEAVTESADHAEILRQIETFEGFVFVKGSRVCELEKALPQAVKEAISNAPKAPAEAAQEEEIKPAHAIKDVLPPEAAQEKPFYEDDEEDEALEQDDREEDEDDDGDNENDGDDENFESGKRDLDDERESF